MLHPALQLGLRQHYLTGHPPDLLQLLVQLCLELGEQLATVPGTCPRHGEVANLGQGCIEPGHPVSQRLTVTGSDIGRSDEKRELGNRTGYRMHGRPSAGTGWD